MQPDLNGVKTVRDFAIVFNSYIKFERQLLQLEHDIHFENDELKGEELQEFKLFRIINLLERRPFLLSDVVLAQNPNDV